MWVCRVFGKGNNNVFHYKDYLVYQPCGNLNCPIIIIILGSLNFLGDLSSCGGCNSPGTVVHMRAHTIIVDFRSLGAEA